MRLILTSVFLLLAGYSAYKTVPLPAQYGSVGAFLHGDVSLGNNFTHPYLGSAAENLSEHKSDNINYQLAAIASDACDESVNSNCNAQVPQAFNKPLLKLAEATQENETPNKTVVKSSSISQPLAVSTTSSQTPEVKSPSNTVNANPDNSAQGNVIKILKNGEVYEVPIILNEVLKINVILDSGATDVSISADVALTLIRTGTIQQSDWLPGKTYKFANGSEAKSYRFQLKSLKMGNKVFLNIPCTIIDSLQAPMLLGQSVLKLLGKYTFDYKKGTLQFE